MKCRFTKLSKNKNALRTNEIVGECSNLPTIGENFILVGESLENKDENAIRIITTSTVVDVKNDETDKYVIHTLNSTYQLEII